MAIRVYADTSVFGGAFDDEFRVASRSFFDQIRGGKFQLVTSEVVEEEIVPAPENVRELFRGMIDEYAEIVRANEAALRLQAAYLVAGVVSPRWSQDALHVAIATVAGCSLLVSWNFRHIVHFEKIPLYNAINTMEGYGHIGIFSPLEVLHYED